MRGASHDLGKQAEFCQYLILGYPRRFMNWGKLNSCRLAEYFDLGRKWLETTWE